jgi:hypothetical protein
VSLRRASSIAAINPFLGVISCPVIKTLPHERLE